MSLLSLLVVLIVAGVLVWLIKQAPFIDERFKTVITYVILAVVVLWLLTVLLPGIGPVRIGQ